MDERLDDNNLSACLNCKTPVAQGYCPVCGQRTDIQRLTFRYIISSFVVSLSNLDRGIFFNLNRMTVAPRKMIMDYIAGRRVHVFNPFQYAIIGVALMIFINQLMGPNAPIETEWYDKQDQMYQAGFAYGIFVAKNIKYLSLLLIVYLAIMSSLFYPKYNLAEHLTIQAFILGHVTIFTTISLFFTDIFLLLNPVLLTGIFLMQIVVFIKEVTWWENLIFSFVILLMGWVMFFLVPFPFHWILNKFT